MIPAGYSIAYGNPTESVPATNLRSSYKALKESSSPAPSDQAKMSVNSSLREEGTFCALLRVELELNCISVGKFILRV